ncbi:MAG: dihydroorotase [Methanobacteriota archaeon]|nr:MAG: dihydroorotase [Euryarchaeota archaeon]
MDAIVRGRCYTDGRPVQQCIGISDGKIAAVSGSLDGDIVYDFGSKLVIPGAVDIHVHMREPGATQKEDFASGSLAALHGGVTCLLDMPNTNPPTTTSKTLREKKELAASRSYADFGLFAGVQAGSDIEALSREGAVGVKLYMAGTTGDLAATSPESLKEELAAVAKTGKVLAVHAEDESLRGRGSESSLADHLKNRRNECETSAIRRLLELSAEGLRVHICHVSARESIPLIANARNVTSEVTPHHLLLDKDAMLGSFGKVNPPLRRREDRQALFAALKETRFDAIASDHAPHTTEEKEEDFDFAPSGMPGVETTLPLMIQLVRERHLTLEDVVRRTSRRPAEMFGLNKGRIAVGYDADLVIIDPATSREIRADDLHYRCAWTPYEGRLGVFPKAVFLRGEIMIEDGSLIGERSGRDVV